MSYAFPAMLISSFFMSLVLVVYSVLPKLRNIVGMILMAYIFTLLATFILKSVQLIALTTSSLDTTTCKRFSKFFSDASISAGIDQYYLSTTNMLPKGNHILKWR